MRPVLLALVAALALAACSTVGRTADARSLDGEWRLVELRGQPVPPLDPEAQPFLRFERDSSRVTGNTGCNLLSGPFSRAGTELGFGPVITTKRACLDESRNQREAELLGALQATRGFTVERDTLTLTGGAGRLARLVRRE